MSIEMSVDQLLEYTEWERAKWREWFGQHAMKDPDQRTAVSALDFC